MSMKELLWIKLMNIGSHFGCHQMPERSFFYKNYQFPVCARCTGVLISSVLSLMVFVKKKISKRLCIVMSGVMLVDWLIQYLGIKESNNRRRLATGIIGGFGYSTLHLYFYKYVYDCICKWINKTGM